MRRQRKAKIVTTIGPASRESEMLEALFERGADVFRLNFSHGSHEDQQLSYERIRAMEAKFGRSTCILADIQGPKLRLGTFEAGSVEVEPGHVITLVLEDIIGTAERVTLPHAISLSREHKTSFIQWIILIPNALFIFQCEST